MCWEDIVPHNIRYTPRCNTNISSIESLSTHRFMRHYQLAAEYRNELTQNFQFEVSKGCLVLWQLCMMVYSQSVCSVYPLLVRLYSSFYPFSQVHVCDADPVFS